MIFKVRSVHIKRRTERAKSQSSPNSIAYLSIYKCTLRTKG